MLKLPARIVVVAAIFLGLAVLATFGGTALAMTAGISTVLNAETGSKLAVDYSRDSRETRLPP